jgi:hypothetical protein
MGDRHPGDGHGLQRRSRRPGRAHGGQCGQHPHDGRRHRRRRRWLA